MTWNYRLILHDLDASHERHWVGLHEVYYEEEKIKGWTDTAVSFVSDGEDMANDVINSLEMALRDAKEKPVLKESEIS
jgi:hypothetical protein